MHERAEAATVADSEGPLAAVVSIRPEPPRAGEPQQAAGLRPKVEDLEQQQQRARFAEIVLPLERKARRRLKEPQLSDCFQSFVDYPEGFADVVRGLVDRSDVKYPILLLAHCVEADEPREAQELLEPHATNPCGCTHEECRYQNRCVHA